MPQALKNSSSVPYANSSSRKLLAQNIKSLPLNILMVPAITKDLE